MLNIFLSKIQKSLIRMRRDEDLDNILEVRDLGPLTEISILGPKLFLFPSLCVLLVGRFIISVLALSVQDSRACLQLPDFIIAVVST